MEKRQKLNQFLLTSPKNKMVQSSKKEQEEFIDLEQRQVDMADF